jgi:hypothetical protein
LDVPLWRFIAYGFVLLVTLSAIWKGGPPERIAGVVMLSAVMLSSISSDYRWISVQYRILLIDGTMMLLLLILALRSDRWWPSFATGFQGLGLLIHLAFALQQKAMSVVYVTALNIIGYLVIASLGVGVIAHVMRQRRRRRSLTMEGR